MMSDLVNECIAFAKEEYAKHDPMHRWKHVEEVMETAYYLEDFYREESDAEILRLAIVFHDIWYENYEDHVDKSVEVARNFLSSKGYPEERIERVIETIYDHSGPHRRKNGNAKKTEGKILYDSDKFHLALTPSGFEKYFDQLYLPETKDLVMKMKMNQII